MRRSIKNSSRWGIYRVRTVKNRAGLVTISEKMIGPGYIMCGDSAAFVDPILSSGITLAITFGLIAGRVINTLLEYGNEDLIYKWYQQAYESTYTNFRSMADFWYLGSGRKEDWFDIASEQIIKDAEVELSKETYSSSITIDS